MRPVNCTFPVSGRMNLAFSLLLTLSFLGFSHLAKAEKSLRLLPAAACNDTINGSLDQECKFSLSGNVLFQGGNTMGCPAPWTLLVRYKFLDTLRVGSIATLGDTIQIRNAYQYRNDFLTVEIIGNDGSDCCVVVIRVLDMFAPQWNCRDTTINCGQDTSVAALGQPVVVENCGGPVQITRSDMVTKLPCNHPSGLIARVVRQWIAVDENGNRDTCEQRINIRRGNLVAVTIENLVQIDCASPSAEPSITGYPTIAGSPLMNDFLCNLWVLQAPDDTIPHCKDATYEILRSWVVGDSCTGDTILLDQVISLIDTTPAVITCPDTILIGTDQGRCWATVILPPPTITDNCTSVPDTLIEIFGIGAGLGPHQMVPPGEYDVLYTAIDCSDSMSTCQSLLIVEDLEEPTAICREYTVVSINSTGMALVPAYTFSEGSYDNCDAVGFKASRDGVNFFDTLKFDCNDVAEDSIMVILKVFEEAREAFFDQCMIWVKVQDKLKPILTCPPNRTVDCGFDLTNLGVFGAPTVIEPCGYTLTETVESTLNQCGVGTLKRTFTAVDSSRNTNVCMQVITVENQTPFTGAGIIWPKDSTFSTCNPPLQPSDLPKGYDRPILPRDTCAFLAVHFKDEPYVTSMPACYKVFRKWTVIDWCTNQTWTHSQTLIVMDVEKPRLTCPSSRIDTASRACDGVFVNLPLATVTDCDPGVTITNNYPNAVGNGANASGTYPKGVTTVTFTARDKCGNVATCATRITVKDLTAPTPKIVKYLSIELGPKDGAVEATLYAKAFDAGSYDNCTAKQDLKFTIRERNPGAGSPPTATSITYTCSDVGLDTIEFWASDAEGNAAYVIGVVEIQDNNNLCSGTKPGIKGVIKTENGAPVANALVRIAGSVNKLDTTDANGVYEFADLPEGGNYSVIPEKTQDLLDGVTTFDLVMLGKHILNVAPLSSPYKIIAADANNSSSVSTLDATALRRAILQTSTEFPNNTSWRFVKENYVFPHPQQPFQQPMDCIIKFENLKTSITNADFVGIKVGDTNGNAKGGNFGNIEERTLPEKMVLQLEDRQFTKGEEFEIPVKTTQQEWLLGFQFALEFDAQKLQITDWSEGGYLDNFTKENFGWPLTEKGKLPVSWNRFTPAGVDAGGTLFFLKIKALEDGKLSDLLKIAPRQMAAEAYDDAEKTKTIELIWQGQTIPTETKVYELFQNRPNPFDQSTSIGFQLPESAKVTFRVTDISGKEIKKIAAEFDAGYHEITLQKEELGDNGVYYYQLETPKFTATKKMVKI